MNVDIYSISVPRPFARRVWRKQSEPRQSRLEEGRGSSRPGLLSSEWLTSFSHLER